MLDQTYDVLIVESDINRQSWITSTLELLGCKLKQTKSIDAGLSQLASTRYDLVLISQDFPAKPCQRLINAVASLHHPFHTPTLMAALGNKNSNLPTHLANSDLTGRLTFPSTINTVGKTIEHWLAADESMPGALIADGYDGFFYKIDENTLPLLFTDQTTILGSSSLSPAKRINAHHSGPTSILLVNDDPIAQEIGLDQLQEAKFNVITANDGAEAIGIICQHRPDLVILDADLPGTGGYQVCKQIRRLDQCENLPIIIITGSHHQAIAEQPNPTQITDYVSKPLSWPMLIHRINMIQQYSLSQKQLALSQRRFGTAQKLTNLGFLDFDLANKLGYTSASFWKILGHEPKGNFSMLDYGQIVHLDDREQYKTEIQESLQTQGTTKIQYRIVNGNGDTRVILATRELTCDSDGIGLRLSSVIQDITEQRDHDGDIQRISPYDELTGFYNRLSFQHEIQQSIILHQSFDACFALLIMNLDNFKRVNDSFNYSSGDKLLVEFSSRVKKEFDVGDPAQKLLLKPIFGRHGGDCFAILLKATNNRATVALAAEKIISALKNPFTIKPESDRKPREIFLTASIGIAEFPNDGAHAGVLQENALTALQAVKASGRNGYRFFDRDLRSSSFRNLNLQSALRDAIKFEQIAVHYLPIISLAGETIVGVEALLRWSHPDLGDLSPSKVIDLAEQTGLIATLSQWIIDQACLQLANWQQAGHPNLIMAINVSPLQFAQDDLCKTITKSIETHQLKPASLQIELTENILMADIKRTTDLLGKLKQIGVGISIDDFGTGCSSLGNLHDFPINNLKIDRRFIRNIDQPSENPGVTQAIIAMGKSLGLQLIAEGIETQVQLDYVRKQGCDFAQGYFFSQPMAAAAATEYLQQSTAQST